MTVMCVLRIRGSNVGVGIVSWSSIMAVNSIACTVTRIILIPNAEFGPSNRASSLVVYFAVVFDGSLNGGGSFGVAACARVSRCLIAAHFATRGEATSDGGS